MGADTQMSTCMEDSANGKQDEGKSKEDEKVEDYTGQDEKIMDGH